MVNHTFDPRESNPRDREAFEKLIDYLQTALPRTQRLLVVSQQQVLDARAVLTALENAVAIVQRRHVPPQGGDQ